MVANEHVNNGDAHGNKSKSSRKLIVKNGNGAKIFVKFYNTELTRIQRAVLGLLHANRLTKRTLLIGDSKGCECS